MAPTTERKLSHLVDWALRIHEVICPDQQSGGAGISKPRREGRIDKTDALRRLEDHGGDARGLDGQRNRR